jgi:glycosyltransferase involved in cell wall biosynthesis
MNRKNSLNEINRNSKALSIQPMVSVIIPTFNRMNFLPEAVKSCLDQSYDNLEIIIIDDGSNDGTEDMVSKMLESTWPSDCVWYVKQKNHGASSARNHGLRIAQGDYIQFLDSDDLLMPKKLAKQIDILEESQNIEAPCCYCYGLYGKSLDNDKKTSLTRIGYRAQNPIELMRKLSSRIVHGMQTSAPLWRRSFLVAHEGWREYISLGDDLEYHVRLLVDVKKICFVDEELFWVRDHATSRLSADQMSVNSLDSLIRTRQSVFTVLQQSGLWDAQTQRSFLSAMRTIYANALQLGNHERIRNLEHWLWKLAGVPEQLHGFRTLIMLRRMLGRHFLLSTHKLTTKILRGKFCISLLLI